MLQTYLSIYFPKSHLGVSGSQHQTRNDILLIQMSSMYKINAKYLTNYMLWQGTGVLGGGKKKEERKTPNFLPIENMKRVKNTSTLKQQQLHFSVHYLRAPTSFFLTRPTGKPASLKWITRTPVIGWNVLERPSLEPLGSGPVTRNSSPPRPWDFTGPYKYNNIPAN